MKENIYNSKKQTRGVFFIIIMTLIPIIFLISGYFISKKLIEIQYGKESLVPLNEQDIPVVNIPEPDSTDQADSTIVNTENSNSNTNSNKENNSEEITSKIFKDYNISEDKIYGVQIGSFENEDSLKKYISENEDIKSYYYINSDRTRLLTDVSSVQEDIKNKIDIIKADYPDAFIFKYDFLNKSLNADYNIINKAMYNIKNNTEIEDEKLDIAIKTLKPLLTDKQEKRLENMISSYKETNDYDNLVFNFYILIIEYIESTR